MLHYWHIFSCNLSSYENHSVFISVLRPDIRKVHILKYKVVIEMHEIHKY